MVMPTTEPTIRVQVDPSNPGQYFACCGLLELADRLWNGAEGWFGLGEFFIQAHENATNASLDLLMEAIRSSELVQINPTDDFSSPVFFSEPFNIRLDWWTDDRAGGRRLKVWAGSMRSVRIAKAMQMALGRLKPYNDSMFNQGMVVFDPLEASNKVEPYYFDARRGANAQSLDIGFAPDALQMETLAFPAVEFLCLVGLQRCRPLPTDKPRMFLYSTWNCPLSVELLHAAVCGLLPNVSGSSFRFENAFRTTQKKHKSFLPAQPLGGDA
jgi:hypothetical protein